METMDRNRALLAQAAGYVYKEAGGHDLAAWTFVPEGHQPTDRRPAILFFFSSSWDSGLVSQFAPHCLHFAQRGAVAMAVEYRVSSQHGTGPLEAMADARSAVRWVRENAEELGIDPQKIVGAGGSAGAHIILSAAMIANPMFDDPADDKATSCVPDALVLFDPVVDVSSKTGFGVYKFPDPRTAKLASPARHVRRGLPPMVLFHGTADRVVSYENTRRFAARMRRWPRRNVCQLMTYERQGHSFFNFNVDPRFFEATITQADAFLVERGFLPPGDETDVRL